MSLSDIVKKNLAAFPATRAFLVLAWVDRSWTCIIPGVFDRIRDDRITQQQQQPSSDTAEHKPHRANMHYYTRIYMYRAFETYAYSAVTSAVYYPVNTAYCCLIVPDILFLVLFCPIPCQDEMPRIAMEKCVRQVASMAIDVVLHYVRRSLDVY